MMLRLGSTGVELRDVLFLTNACLLNLVPRFFWAVKYVTTLFFWKLSSQLYFIISQFF